MLDKLRKVRGKMTYQQMNNKLADVSAQLEELRKGRIITESDEVEYRRLHAEHAEMKRVAGKMAKWLKANKQAEIDRGEHKGLDLADVMIRYASKGL